VTLSEGPPTLYPSLGINFTTCLKPLAAWTVPEPRGVELGSIRLQAAWDPGMALAIILLLSIACFAAAPWERRWMQVDADTSPSEASSSRSSFSRSYQSPASANSSQTQAAPPSQSQTGAAAPTTATKKGRGRHKKKATNTPIECPPVNGASSAASGETSGGKAASQTQSSEAQSSQVQSNQSPPTQVPQGQAQTNQTEQSQPPSNKDATRVPTNPSAPANCPPKTVIREGGTSEPAIQLVGGKGAGQAPQQHSATDDVLDSTEANLKKVAGKQLNASQQEMVNQIQAFIQQSRAALAAGDLERGRNLAQKAHLLSDELVKP
jgi:hypothetical protein